MYIVIFVYALIVMFLWRYDVGDCMEKYTSMKSWRRSELRFPLEALGAIGIESWCLLLVLWFRYFMIFLCFIFSFVCVWCKALLFCLWCHIFIGFHLLFLYVSCSLLFCFDGIGNWFGKRKFDGAQGELCGMQ